MKNLTNATIALTIATIYTILFLTNADLLVGVITIHTGFNYLSQEYIKFQELIAPPTKEELLARKLAQLEALNYQQLQSQVKELQATNKPKLNSKREHLIKYLSTTY